MSLNTSQKIEFAVVVLSMFGAICIAALIFSLALYASDKDDEAIAKCKDTGGVAIRGVGESFRCANPSIFVDGR